MAPPLVAKPAPAPVAKPSAPSSIPAVPAPIKNAEIKPLPQSPPVIGDQHSLPDFRQALVSELSLRSETKTAVQAFNALTSLWQVAPVSRLNERTPLIKQLKSEAAKRDLELDNFNGKMDELLRIDTPALLEISRKGAKGPLLVALTGSSGGRVRVHPPLLGRSAFSKAELASLWSGRAYILWRNGENIGLPMSQGAAGNDVIRVQILLQAAGAGSLEVNGLYDENTAKAVKEFQKSKKISVTGKLGPLTLIRLYRAVLGQSSPGLAARAKGEGL